MTALTDEQIAEGLAGIPRRLSALSADDWAMLGPITKGLFAALSLEALAADRWQQADDMKAERDEARKEAEWQQRRAIAAENRNDDLRQIHTDELQAARQQARREAFEEAAKEAERVCGRAANGLLGPGIAHAIRALAEVSDHKHRWLTDEDGAVWPCKCGAAYKVER